MLQTGIILDENEKYRGTGIFKKVGTMKDGTAFYHIFVHGIEVKGATYTMTNEQVGEQVVKFFWREAD